MALTDDQRITIMAMAHSGHSYASTAAPAAESSSSREQTIAEWTEAIESFGSRDNYNRCLMIAFDAARRIRALPESSTREERQALIHEAIGDSRDNWLKTGDVPGVTLEKFRAHMAIANQRHAARKAAEQIEAQTVAAVRSRHAALLSEFERLDEPLPDRMVT